MSARDNILSRLREARPPFNDAQPIEARRHVVPPAHLSESELLGQFRVAAEGVGCAVYEVNRSEAIEQIMDLLDGDESVLSWDAAQLPLDDAHNLLESLGVSVAAHDRGDVRVGLTGVNAALAATGSLLLESGAGRNRNASLLPDVHIALMRADQIVPDLETWAAAQGQGGYPAFRDISNTVIVTGPSKTADIGHQLVKGAHGPREVHVLVLT